MTSLENLIKDHSIFPLMINLLILITFSFGHMLMLFGEDLRRSLCRSLLGLQVPRVIDVSLLRTTAT